MASAFSFKNPYFQTCKFLKTEKPTSKINYIISFSNPFLAVVHNSSIQSLDFVFILTKTISSLTMCISSSSLLCGINSLKYASNRVGILIPPFQTASSLNIFRPYVIFSRSHRSLSSVDVSSPSLPLREHLPLKNVYSQVPLLPVWSPIPKGPRRFLLPPKFHYRLSPPPGEFKSSPRVAIMVAVIVCLVNGVVFWHWDLARDEAIRLHDFKRFRFMMTHAQASLFNLYEGRWWTLVVSIFSHQNLAHLLVNCVAIYSFLSIVVYKFGVWKALSVYLGAGVFGNYVALQRMMNEENPFATLPNGPTKVWDLLFPKGPYPPISRPALYLGSNPEYGPIIRTATFVPQSWATGLLGASGAVYATAAIFACLFPYTEFFLFFVYPVKAGIFMPLDFIAEYVLCLLNYEKKFHVAFDAHVSGTFFGVVSSLFLLPAMWKRRSLYCVGIVKKRIWSNKAKA